jgi:hypothetical protein
LKKKERERQGLRIRQDQNKQNEIPIGPWATAWWACRPACPRWARVAHSLGPSHYKNLQLCQERKCKIGMGKRYTQFYRK